ncbi:MAG TPA: acyclic terpene utilization AtuA family protein [Ramlibacter sp.]|uniref:acyclic terpene utilization AtuA family protein n=1 Tax=Ramlibacter sp. TaxID=1917967 RepID=UPI002ED467A1
MLRIGCGAGFSGDRWDAAVPVVRTLAALGGPAVLMFETLAERTLALAQLQRRQNPDSGWEPSLERFLRPVLADCVRAGIPIVGNFGAAHPRGAAARVQQLAATLGLPPLRVAVVEGDDLLASLPPARMRELLPAELRDRPLVSANAYLGAQQIADALRAGAQVVVTGRVADPALALGPMLAHFDWAADDWDRLAAGTMAGHLLECGAQVTGGYFADPGRKDVPDLAHVGFPIVEMHADGRFVVTKAAGTGGCVDRRTVTEQLLYEIHDPAAYLTPDVVADITQVELHPAGPDRVEVRGVLGHPRPATLKATVCHEGGWLGEGEISYAGPNAAARARLAADVVRERLRTLGLGHLRLRADLIGMASVFADDAGRWWDQHAAPESEDVRLRIAAASTDRGDLEQLTREVLALYTCGPAGGGGVRTSITPRLASDSCYVPRDWLHPAWSFAA